jgi:glycosyltransferase involved in cell wall biosynthesis
LYEFCQYADGNCFGDIDILAVSDVAKNNFCRYFPDTNVEVLTYGIPDEAAGYYGTGKKERLVFAVIGSIEVRKAQDIFIEAADKLNCADAEFWIIGKNHQDDYCQRVRVMADGNLAIRFFGVMTREQMHKLYPEIDVVVCSSREETMSITTTEGMMYGKTCIVSDHAGMADYVDDGKSGFVFESGNSDDLCAKMRWCVENRDKLGTIGRNARNTYEEFFTIEKFGKRLEKIVEECI